MPPRERWSSFRDGTVGEASAPVEDDRRRRTERARDERVAELVPENADEHTREREENDLGVAAARSVEDGEKSERRFDAKRNAEDARSHQCILRYRGRNLP